MRNPDPDWLLHKLEDAANKYLPLDPPPPVKQWPDKPVSAGGTAPEEKA